MTIQTWPARNFLLQYTHVTIILKSFCGCTCGGPNLARYFMLNSLLQKCVLQKYIWGIHFCHNIHVMCVVFQQKDAELLQQKADEQRRAAEQRWLHDNFTQDGETGTHTLPTVAQQSPTHTSVLQHATTIRQQCHTHATHERNSPTLMLPMSSTEPLTCDMLPPLTPQCHTQATHELNGTTNCHHCCTHVPPPLVNITIHTHTHHHQHIKNCHGYTHSHCCC